MTEQFILTSNDQQTQLNVRHWPCPSPKAVVQLIHGMAEHIQRYDEFARFLNQLGFTVIGHDHLGHGESVQPNAPIYGFFGEQGPENVVTDIHQVKQWAVNRYPQLPYGVFRLAQLSARLSCDCARSHFHGHWNKSVTFNRSIAFY